MCVTVCVSLALVVCVCYWHWQAFQGEAAAHMLPGGWLAVPLDNIFFHFILD